MIGCWCNINSLFSKKICFSRTISRLKVTYKFMALATSLVVLFYCCATADILTKLLQQCFSSSSVVCPQCSNIFFSETPGPIKAKFYVEPPWVGGTIFCSRHLGHMTKMAATPIYGKNPSKIFFSRTGGPIFTKLGM